MEHFPLIRFKQFKQFLYFLSRHDNDFLEFLRNSFEVAEYLEYLFHF